MVDGGWFGRGFVAGNFKPPVPGTARETDGDVYNRRRYFLKPGEAGKRVIFLENMDTGLMIVEHAAWDAANKPHRLRFPCLSALGKPCWCCQQDGLQYRNLLMSVIDCTGFIVEGGKDAGKHITNIKKLLPIPYMGLGVFTRHQNRLRSLKFYEFEVSRSPVKQSSAIGDDWQCVLEEDGRPKMHSPDALKAANVDITPYDYDKIVPFSMTTEGQEEFFRTHPSVSLNTRKSAEARAPRESGDEESQDTSSPAPRMPVNAPQVVRRPPPASTSFRPGGPISPSAGSPAVSQPNDEDRIPY